LSDLSRVAVSAGRPPQVCAGLCRSAASSCGRQPPETPPYRAARRILARRAGNGKGKSGWVTSRTGCPPPAQDAHRLYPRVVARRSRQTAVAGSPSRSYRPAKMARFRDKPVQIPASGPGTGVVGMTINADRKRSYVAMWGQSSCWHGFCMTHPGTLCILMRNWRKSSQANDRARKGRKSWQKS